MQAVLNSLCRGETGLASGIQEKNPDEAHMSVGNRGVRVLFASRCGGCTIVQFEEVEIVEVWGKPILVDRGLQA